MKKLIILFLLTTVNIVYAQDNILDGTFKVCADDSDSKIITDWCKGKEPRPEFFLDSIRSLVSYTTYCFFERHMDHSIFRISPRRDDRGTLLLITPFDIDTAGRVINLPEFILRKNGLNWCVESASNAITRTEFYAVLGNMRRFLKK